MSARPSERPIRDGDKAEVVEKQGDEKWMAIALENGAAGTPSPNPHVGAVLVKGGQVVGSGHHERAGEDHAEIVALREAGPRADWEGLIKERAGDAGEGVGRPGGGIAFLEEAGDLGDAGVGVRVAGAAADQQE